MYLPSSQDATPKSRSTSSKEKRNQTCFVTRTEFKVVNTANVENVITAVTDQSRTTNDVLCRCTYHVFATPGRPPFCQNSKIEQTFHPRTGLWIYHSRRQQSRSNYQINELKLSVFKLFNFTLLTVSLLD